MSGIARVLCRYERKCDQLILLGGGIAPDPAVVVTTETTLGSSNGGTVEVAHASFASATAGDIVYAYYGTAWNAPTQILSVLANKVAPTNAEDPTGDALAPELSALAYLHRLSVSITYNITARAQIQASPTSLTPGIGRAIAHRSF